MRELKLTQGTLENCCSDLQALTQKLSEILGSFQDAFTKLDVAWDGDAQEEFREAYYRLYEQYAKLANEIAPAYVNSLHNIINTYSDNENQICGKIASL